MGECNETVVSLEQVKDIYGSNPVLCDELIEIYDISGRQLYKLGESWQQFKNKEKENRTRHDPNPYRLPNLNPMTFQL